MRNIYVADFETLTPNSVDDISKYKTDVWGAGICEIGEEDVKIFDNIDGFMEYCCNLPGRNPTVYFHNLKFDGSFIVDYFLRVLKLRFVEDVWKVKLGEFGAVISNMGVWYVIRAKYKRKIIEFRDSEKLLPFKVEQIAEQLGTKAKKLKGTIDYRRERDYDIDKDGKKHYKLDEADIKYLKNDVLIMAEALKKIEPYGLLKYLTIGSCCMADYKERMGGKFDYLFPVLEQEIDEKLRNAYHGGWCYVKEPGKDNNNVNGFTYDINSLYPWAMHSNEGHYYPVGVPKKFDGKDFLKYYKNLWIINIRIMIKLKEGKLPFIQIEKNGPYITETEDIVSIWITKPDYELLLECYDLLYIDVIEGYMFGALKGIFDEYIEYWYNLKKNAENEVERQIAKLMLNNLSGKMATSPNVSVYIPCLVDDNERFIMKEVKEIRKSVYVPVAAYITSYARCKTIRAAIENINVFQYSDTDSMHCKDEAKNIKVGDGLGEWKIEGRWNRAKFLRSKTYIENMIKDDNTYWNIKASGCPEEVKERLLYKVDIFEPLKKDEEGNILNEKRTDDDFVKRFDIGLKESGKLMSKRVYGGVILIDSTFEIRAIDKMSFL